MRAKLCFINNFYMITIITLIQTICGNDKKRVKMPNNRATTAVGRPYMTERGNTKDF
jgi:hypothetical protein